MFFVQQFKNAIDDGNSVRLYIIKMTVYKNLPLRDHTTLMWFPDLTLQMEYIQQVMLSSWYKWRTSDRRCSAGECNTCMQIPTWLTGACSLQWICLDTASSRLSASLAKAGISCRSLSVWERTTAGEVAMVHKGGARYSLLKSCSFSEPSLGTHRRCPNPGPT